MRKLTKAQFKALNEIYGQLDDVYLQLMNLKEMIHKITYETGVQK